MHKYVVVAHKDFDGIVSAAGIIMHYCFPIGETQVLFTQPSTLVEVEIPEEARKVVVVDVGINNRNPQMTMDFIKKVENRLMLWIDHHQGWPESFLSNDQFLIIPGAKSCAGMFVRDPELKANADAMDTRIGEVSPWAQTMEQAMKANPKDDSLRLLLVRWILGEKQLWPEIEEAAKAYTPVKAETERLVAQYAVQSNIARVDAKACLGRYDLTQLLVAGQKMADFAIVETGQNGNSDIIEISTYRKDINLVKVFDLPGGAAFRVSLPSKRLEEAVAKLSEIKGDGA